MSDISDSSEDEDLSRFREAVDTSFTKLIDLTRGKAKAEKEEPKQKSERYLEVASHYNDVKVPVEMQKKIGSRISAIINKNIEFVEVPHNGIKKHKVKGGIKLFKDSKCFLSCDGPVDTYTEGHNAEAKKMLKVKRKIDDIADLNENDKIDSVVLTGEYVLSKEETKCWKSRRKEKLYKYKLSNKNGKILTAIE